MGYCKWPFDTERKDMRSYFIFHNTDSCINLDGKMQQSHSCQNSKFKNTKAAVSGAAKNHFLKLHLVRKYLESALKKYITKQSQYVKTCSTSYFNFECTIRPLNMAQCSTKNNFN